MKNPNFTKCRISDSVKGGNFIFEIKLIQNIL